MTPCNRCGAIGHWEEDCIQLARSRKKRSPSAKGKGKSRRFRREKSDGKGRGGSSNLPIVEVYNDGSKTQTSHMKVPPGYAVLDCNAANNLYEAKPVALMAQTCAREGKRVGDERDTEAIDESYHFRRIGNQIVSSFMKLRVPGSIDGKEVSFAPSVTPGDIPPLAGNDHLIPWCCSIHLYPDECRLEIPSRGIDAKLLVTTSNHILVNLADFEGVDEPDYDVWTSKRSRDSEETGTESDMTEGTEGTTTDPKKVPAKRSRRGVPRKPRIPRKKPPAAYIQLSPALQSELRKLQLQEAHRHQQLNGQKSQGLQTRLSRCFFLTRDQDRWKFQLSTIVRISGSSMSLSKNSLVPHNGYMPRQWVFGLIPHLKTKLRVLNIVDAASEMHIAIQNLIVRRWDRWKRMTSQMGEFQTMSDELTDAKEQLRMASPSEREMREMLMRKWWR